MLHTRSQGHWAFGPKEEDISRDYTLYGHFGHVTINIRFVTNLLPQTLEISVLNSRSIGPVISKKTVRLRSAKMYLVLYYKIVLQY